MIFFLFQIALNLLSCLDTLNWKNEYRALTQEPASRNTSIRRTCSKEDFALVDRFESEL